MADLSHLSDDELDAQIAAQTAKPGLAQMSDADLDRAIHAAQPKPSAMASGARQVLSGFTGSFDDELSGAVGAAGRLAGVQNLGTFKPFNPDSHLQYAEPTLDPSKLVDAYRQNRDVARKEQHQDIAANPAVSAVANTGGMLLNPMLRSMGPTGMGAVQGLGNSEADLTKGDVVGAAEDTAIGTGIGYLGGRAAKAATEVAAPALQKFANKNAVRAIGMSAGDIEAAGTDISKDVGETALDKGVISANPLDNSADAMLARAKGLPANNAYGSQMVKSLSEKSAADLAGDGKGFADYINPLKIVQDTVGKPAFMASTANSLSTILEKSPQVFGKWAPALIQASKRGNTSLNATDYVLQQTDPAYRAKRQELNNMGENGKSD